MWAGYELSAVSYSAQVFLLLVPGILFPGALLVFADTTFRVLIIVLGLVFGLATQTFMNLGGPDSPGLVMPWLGYCSAAGAVVAELVMFVRRLLRGKSEPQAS
jgi:hypothetical protein